MDKIGPYQILEAVHRGAQPLYRAKGKDGKEVAIKTVAAAGLSEEARARFLREAETCRAMDHPNIVKMFDAGEADGYLYQAMEMLVGMEQVAEGLEYAHARKLVHRDIKPANLFLENSGRVKVLDFGMVHVAESELTKVNSSLGTLNYMAPEQIRGDKCTAAADVFSAGIVFYQLATGRHPFSTRERTLPQVVSAIVFEAPPKLSEIRPDAPEGLEFILNRALEKDPARRIPNAGDLRQALGLCRMTLGMAPSAPAPAPIPASDPNEGKTRVVPKLPQPMNPPAAPPDEAKTVVAKRANPPSVSLPPPAQPKPSSQIIPPRSHPPSQSGSGLRFRYCSNCTTPNNPDATVCARCKAPLGGPRAGAAASQARPQWPLYVAIAVAGVLAVALVLVLLMRKG
jgi:serine/threonine protein kinase